MKPQLNIPYEGRDFQPLPNELEIENRILELLVKDEEFTRSVNQINEDGEYIESRLKAIEIESVREQAEEMILDRMWRLAVPREGMGEFGEGDFRTLMEGISSDARSAQAAADRVNNRGIVPLAAAAGLSVGGVLAGTVIATVTGITGIGIGVGAAIGAGIAESGRDGALGDFAANRSHLNRIIEDLQDSASRLHEAREDLDLILSRVDQEDQDAQDIADSQ